MAEVETNLIAMQNLVDAWGSHDTARVEPFFSPDFVNFQTPFAPVRGRANYLKHCDEWFQAYPDLAFEIVSLFGQGPLVCLELYVRGTNLNSFFGAAPTGATEVVRSCDVFEFQGDTIVRERGYWDFSVTTGRVAPRGREDPRTENRESWG